MVAASCLKGDKGPSHVEIVLFEVFLPVWCIPPNEMAVRCLRLLHVKWKGRKKNNSLLVPQVESLRLCLKGNF